jgi:hypothetical protein
MCGGRKLILPSSAAALRELYLRIHLTVAHFMLVYVIKMIAQAEALFICDKQE